MTSIIYFKKRSFILFFGPVAALLFLAALLIPFSDAVTQKITIPRFSWPVVKGVMPKLFGITSTFAESREDHFHNGLDISSVNDAVHPVADGSYLYSRSKEDDPFFPEMGPGNFVFLDHGNGWWSGYYHLEKVLQTSTDRITKENEIAVTGNTGHSVGAHLHFFIIKDFGKVYINPLDVLPSAEDLNSPIIGQISIVTPDRRMLLSQNKTQNIRLSRPYPFLITIIDPGLEKSTRRGIYRLKWTLNNGKEQSRSFNQLSLVNGNWILPGGEPFEKVYYDDLYNLGELNFIDGDNILKITAEDFNGNSSSAEYSIHVTKEY